MAHTLSLKRTLIDVDDSFLLVIDVQKSFLRKAPRLQRRRLLRCVCWLVDVAVRLDVPLLVTAENIPEHGEPHPALCKRLPPGTPVFNKMTFALTAEPPIFDAVQRATRQTAILVGMETDVCVMHSALGLLQHDYAVVVVADATWSPDGGHTVGLDRIRRAGALVTSLKSVLYEWLRSVERSRAFFSQYGKEIGSPPVGL
jgi:nicotinamidase-related amidase